MVTIKFLQWLVIRIKALSGGLKGGGGKGREVWISNVEDKKRAEEGRRWTSCMEGKLQELVETTMKNRSARGSKNVQASGWPEGKVQLNEKD